MKQEELVSVENMDFNCLTGQIQKQVMSQANLSSEFPPVDLINPCKIS